MSLTKPTHPLSIIPPVPDNQCYFPPYVFDRPEWAMDKRHLHFINHLICCLPLRDIAEIGMSDGACTYAILNGMSFRNRLGYSVANYYGCDIDVTENARKVLDLPVGDFQNSFNSYKMNSISFLPHISDYLLPPGKLDFLLIDGDHSHETVKEEVALALSMDVHFVVAHDTSLSLLGHSHATGPAYLKHKFNCISSYNTLEDNRQRRGERTERGLFIATNVIEWFLVAKRLYAYWMADNTVVE